MSIQLRNKNEIVKMQYTKYNRPLSIQPTDRGSLTKSKIIRAKSLASEHAADETKKAVRVKPPFRRSDSMVALEELVVCGICLNRLENSKMLQCQHTFCCKCLKSVAASAPIFQCPICQQTCDIANLDELPSNIYINNLIGLLNDENDAIDTVDNNRSMVKTASVSVITESCISCNTICEEHNIVKCQHCNMNFCTLCYPQHADDLTERFPNFLKQLNEHEMRLEFEQKDYKGHCDRLSEDIKQGIATKVQELEDLKVSLLHEVDTLNERGNMEIEDISGKISKLKNNVQFAQNDSKPHNKVMQYMSYHQEISKILDTITQLSSNYKQFNLESFTLDAALSPLMPNVGPFIYDAIDSSQVTSPELLLTYYKNMQFVPKASYQKFQKPTGVCASPWDAKQVYVCNMKIIYVYDIALCKVTSRLMHENMTCPQSIACSANTSEIFVADKWMNCVHVFNTSGEYLRKMLTDIVSNPHGIALTKSGDLLLCDTGNDRVLIVDAQSGKIKNAVGMAGERGDHTELSMPTDVATNGKIIVIADVGNNRIKIFDAGTLKRLHVFGSYGKQKGQMRSAEVVHVDDGGFILVGDSGNRRIQIFDSKGNFVKCTTSECKFNWISGLCTNANSDIIITDYRSKTLLVF